MMAIAIDFGAVCDGLRAGGCRGNIAGYAAVFFAARDIEGISRALYSAGVYFITPLLLGQIWARLGYVVPASASDPAIFSDKKESFFSDLPMPMPARCFMEHKKCSD